MGKRVYSTTEVDVGGTRIKVRQVLLQGKDIVPQQVAAATVSARMWFDLAMPRYLSHAGVARITPEFRFCFHCDPEPQYVNTVMSVLGTIRSALNRPFAVKVLDMNDGTLGYVSRRYSGCVQQVMGVQQFDKDDDLIHSRGEMHLARSVLKTGDVAGVTLIHEAGHKFANLRDHGWRGYFDSQFNGYEDNTLPAHECLYNADSYAVFVYLLANPELARRRIPSYIRAQNRAAAAADDNLEGLHNLFG